MAENLNQDFHPVQFVDQLAQYQSSVFQNLDLEHAMMYLNKVTIPPTINYPDMSEFQKDGIRELMAEWGLPFLTPILLRECIDINRLKCISIFEVEKMLRHVPMGYQIDFRHMLDNYKNQTSTSITTIQESNTILTNVIQLDPNILNIKDILKMSFLGRNVQMYYEQHGFIIEIHRKNLRDAIYTYVVDQNIKWTLQTAENFAEQIVRMFPTEIKEVYYNKSNNKTGGILFHNFYNFKRSLVLPNKSKSNYKDLVEASQISNNTEQIIPEDVERHMKALSGSSHSSWSEVEEHWAATCAMRINEFKVSTENAFNNWPQYKEQLGYRLVNLDYAFLYPQSTALLEIFQGIQKKLLEIFERSIKDVGSRRILKKLKDNWDTISDSQISQKLR